jgi:UDP-3-O-[3-hydroxymyristoyl] glucosamine N-acyltransferase
MDLQKFAKEIGGRIEGDQNFEILALSSLADAQEGDLSFLISSKYTEAMASTHASAILVDQEWQGECTAILVRVDHPDAAFSKAALLLSPPPPHYAPGVHATAVVADDAKLAQDVRVGPHCVIESGASIASGTVLVAACYIGHDCQVGENCLLYPNVTLRERTIVGDRAIIHSGAELGSDGFGYTPIDGKWIKVPQVGYVECGDDVEIGANTTIDRARFGRTIIEDGVKLDNLVQVAHNVRIGAHTALASQVGIAGSCVIGSGVQMAGQVGIAGHLEVGDNCIVGGQAGITKNIPPGSFVTGCPARPFKEARRSDAMLHRLPKLKARIDALEKTVQAISANENNEDEAPA